MTASISTVVPLVPVREPTSTTIPPPVDPPPAANDTLWTADEVAAFLRVSVSWVRHRVAANKLPHHRVGGWMVRFDPAEIRAWATRRRG